MDSFDIFKYINIALRRKWWIIIPFLCTILIGLTYTLVTPKIYESETLILVQRQKVPEDFIRSIVSDNLEDRLRLIEQQVMSRTNLERIIKEFNLESELGQDFFAEDQVDILRENISIEVSGEGREKDTEINAFTISFRGENPRKAMQVTNALASNFITENLRIRESQAMGTSGFLSEELESVEKQLIAKEEELKAYRERHMGGLPEQLQTNLTILERLQGQLDQLLANLRDLENRRILFQTQLSEQQKADSASYTPLNGSDGRPTDVARLKAELASLRAKYTEKHPDIIRLKEIIANIEAQTPGTEAEGQRASLLPSMTALALKTQLQDTELEIKSNKTEIEEVRSQINLYEIKVEETPKREQELLSLNRDYDNLKQLYNSLLNRKLEAQMSVSMERKQKGEQFRIIDPARIPTTPVKPKIEAIFLLSVILGIGLGGGLAFLVEGMDTSYKSPEEVEEELELPVLVSMPIRYTQKEMKTIKIRKALAYSSVTVGFVLSAATIILATKGIDQTVEYIKRVIEKI